MNILLINHYAGSLRHGMEYRPYYFAREWTRAGHPVTIVAASFSHLRTRLPEIHGSVTEEMLDGIRYVWLKTPAYSENGAARAANIFAFIGQFLWHLRLIIQISKPNVVIASSTYPLDAIPARIVSNITGARMVFEVHDLWPLHLIEVGGMSKTHPFVQLLYAAEAFAYRATDYAVSLLPNAKEYMISRGMSPEKFVPIPNGIDLDEWQQNHAELPATHRTQIEEQKKLGKFLVCYAGAHGISNALHALLDAADLLRGQPVTIILIGQGQEKENLQKQAEALGLDNVIFLPPVPKERIPAALARMDALYIGLKSEPIFRFGISPNKLMDYMMAAKPVICAIKAGNDIVTESGCGLSIPPENPGAIRDATLKLMGATPLQREQMGKAGRKYVLQRHDYRQLAQKFLEQVGK